MRKLIINKELYTSLKNRISEANISKALYKVNNGDIVIITTKHGQYNLEVVDSISGQIICSSELKGENYYVYFDTTALNNDNRFEFRTLKDVKDNEEKFKKPGTWQTTTFKDVESVKVYNNDKTPKFNLDVERGVSSDEPIPKKEPEPLPEPEEEEDEYDDTDDETNSALVRKGLNNPIIRSAFMKHPKFWDLVKNKDRNGIMKATELISKYYTIPDGSKDFVKQFRQGDAITVRLLSSDFKHGLDSLVINQTYVGVVSKIRDVVLIKLNSSPLNIILKELVNKDKNIYTGFVREPLGDGQFNDIPNKFKVNKNI